MHDLLAAPTRVGRNIFDVIAPVIEDSWIEIVRADFEKKVPASSQHVLLLDITAACVGGRGNCVPAHPARCSSSSDAWLASSMALSMGTGSATSRSAAMSRHK